MSKTVFVNNISLRGAGISRKCTQKNEVGQGEERIRDSAGNIRMRLKHWALGNGLTCTWASRRVA